VTRYRPAGRRRGADLVLPGRTKRVTKQGDSLHRLIEQGWRGRKRVPDGERGSKIYAIKPCPYLSLPSILANATLTRHSISVHWGPEKSKCLDQLETSTSIQPLRAHQGSPQQNSKGILPSASIFARESDRGGEKGI